MKLTLGVHPNVAMRQKNNKINYLILDRELSIVKARKV
jgi:hypothetical protein